MARSQREWQRQCLQRLAALKAETPVTPLYRLRLPAFPEAEILIKDERAHASGSLKHRLAMSLFEQALVEGWLTPGRPVIEASSGSTAVSEAWLARKLGMEFIAVVPSATAPDKLAAIQAEGGKVVKIDDAALLCHHAQQLAERHGGHFINQFCHAATASDWRSEKSLPGECLSQINAAGLPALNAVFIGAGTGGTAATFARHLRLKGQSARVVGVDPEHSVYLDCWHHYRHHAERLTDCAAPKAPNPIEGIGRPCMLEAFRPEDFDDYRVIDDHRSQAAALWLATSGLATSELATSGLATSELATSGLATSELATSGLAEAERTEAKLTETALRTPRDLAVGPSTGTAFAGLLETLQSRHTRGESVAGSWLLLACDSASRYATTLGCEQWRARHQTSLARHNDWIDSVTRQACMTPE